MDEDVYGFVDLVWVWSNEFCVSCDGVYFCYKFYDLDYYFVFCFV